MRQKKINPSTLIKYGQFLSSIHHNAMLHMDDKPDLNQLISVFKINKKCNG